MACSCVEGGESGMLRFGDRFVGVMSPLKGNSGDAIMRWGEGIVACPLALDFLCVPLPASWLDNIGSCELAEHIVLLEDSLLRNVAIADVHLRSLREERVWMLVAKV